MKETSRNPNRSCLGCVWNTFEPRSWKGEGEVDIVKVGCRFNQARWNYIGPASVDVITSLTWLLGTDCPFFAGDERMLESWAGSELEKHGYGASGLLLRLLTRFSEVMNLQPPSDQVQDLPPP